MKLLLDMYRSAPKEQRDKVQLMAAEKKTKSEVINSAHPINICPPDTQVVGFSFECSISGRGAATEAEGVGGEGEERGEENGR